MVDLLAAVPYILGFRPSDSLVVLGAAGARVVITARPNLIRDPQASEHVADHIAAVMAAHHIDESYLVGYGPASLVTA